MSFFFFFFFKRESPCQEIFRTTVGYIAVYFKIVPSPKKGNKASQMQGVVDNEIQQNEGNCTERKDNKKDMGKEDKGCIEFKFLKVKMTRYKKLQEFNRKG